MIPGFKNAMTAFFLVPGILTVFPSCKKSNGTPKGNGCITQVAYQFPSLLNQNQVHDVEGIFSANNLPTEGLSFYNYEDAWPADNNGHQTIARVNEYVNGLPVFFGDRVYHFTDGKFDASWPDPYSPPTEDTTTKRSLSELQSLFLAHVEDCAISGIAYDPHAKGPSPEAYKDTCLQVSKVYLDAADIPGSKLTPGKSLVVAWRITPENVSAPLVYVVNSTGKAWGVLWGYE